MIYEQHKTKIHSIIFILCVLFALISPPYNQSSAQQNVIKEATGSVASGMVETIQTDGKTDKIQWGRLNASKFQSSDKVWKIQQDYKIRECNQECKINTLIWLGIIEEIASSLVMNCKALADDPVRCIKIWAFITIAESGGWKNCKKSNKYNCFGLSVQEDYKSYNDGVLHFIWKYNRFWHKQTNPNGFYSNSPDWKPATRFCLSEHSSWLPYCKNWHRIAWSVFNKLNF